MTTPVTIRIDPSRFIDNPATAGRPDAYMAVEVRLAEILSSWRESLFSYEWMRPDGTLKDPGELREREFLQREAAEGKLRAGGPLERPVLGLGISDNIEIGSGKGLLLTLAGLGVTTAPVHIPKTHLKDFRPFLKGVD